MVCAPDLLARISLNIIQWRKISAKVCVAISAEIRIHGKQQRDSVWELRGILDVARRVHGIPRTLDKPSAGPIEWSMGLNA